jgi:hypothetical protein
MRPGSGGSGENVVVDGLGKPDYGQFVIIVLQELGQIGCRRVGVVPTNRVEHVDPILDQLVSGDFLRIIPVLDEAALHAIGHIGQLDPAVPDSGTPKLVKDAGIFPDNIVYLDGITEQESLVTTAIADDLN